MEWMILPFADEIVEYRVASC